VKIESTPKRILISLVLAGLTICIIVVFWLFYLSSDCENIEQRTEINECTGRIANSSIPYLVQPGNVGDQVVESQSNFSVVRATSNVMYGEENGKARHHYSRRSVWNLDEDYLILAGNLVRSEDLSIVQRRPGGMSNEQIWSTVEPGLIYGIAYSHEAPKGMNLFGSFNIDTDLFTAITKFPDHNRCRIGNGKGVLSYDDQLVVIDCQNKDNPNVKSVYSLDVGSGQIIGSTTVQSDFRWGGVTPSGQFILMQFTNTEEDTTALYRYSLDFKDKYLLSENVEHGDIGVDLDGNDIYAMIGWEHLMTIRVSDGYKTAVSPFGLHDINRFFDKDFLLGFGHLSCRNVLRPGWCYFASSNSKILGSFAIGYKSNNRSKVEILGETYNRGIRAFEYWGNHNSSESTYDAQSKVSVSPSGKKIIVTSDWENAYEVNDYIINIKSN